MKFSDKTAIVTGGNSGIGKAIAASLAKEGTRLIISGRRSERNEAVAAELKEQFGAQVIPVTADVSNEEDCLRLVSTAEKEWGRLDILVNNAGIGVSSPSIAESKTDDLEKVMRTNVYSAFWCSRAAWPLLKANEPDPESGVRGSIINIASLCSVDAWAGVGLYAMSKHAMLAMSRTLSDEGVNEAIRSVALCPGMVATAMTGAGRDEAMQPENIAKTAMYFLSLSSMAWPREIVLDRRGAD